MDDIKVGKFISYVLRHHPEEIGITLDKSGYADTRELIEGVAKRFEGFDMESLERIVRENNKQRFAFNSDKTKIRASQGHSLKNIDLGLSPVSPPKRLFHGTAERFLPAILQEGLKPMSRQHVHLSADFDTAVKVGTRHGRPVVLIIDSEKMSDDGYTFFLSENKVWLTDCIPPQYIFVQGSDNNGA